MFVELLYFHQNLYYESNNQKQEYQEQICIKNVNLNAGASLNICQEMYYLSSPFFKCVFQIYWLLT